MTRLLRAINLRLALLGKTTIATLAAVLSLFVGYVDYGSGSEISASLFYLVPVALAAWYAGRRVGLAIAVLSCVCWYFADALAGNHYSHPAIAIWNALIRLGFFCITNSLLSALRISLRNARQLAQTDALTGLFTRRAFTDRLAHDLAMAGRRSTPLSLAYLDLDDFKQVNDTRGHLAGDQVLCTIADLLGKAIRQSDTAARLGGDEFGLILPDTGSDGAQLVVGDLLKTLNDMHEAGTLPLTSSVGVITVLPPHASLDEVISAADQLMYEAKRGGKAAVRFSVRGSTESLPAS